MISPGLYKRERLYLLKFFSRIMLNLSTKKTLAVNTLEGIRYSEWTNAVVKVMMITLVFVCSIGEVNIVVLNKFIKL